MAWKDKKPPVKEQEPARGVPPRAATTSIPAPPVEPTEPAWPQAARQELASERARVASLQAELDRITPEYQQLRATKADLGRQQLAKDVELAELARKQALVEDARQRLEGERSRLVADAAPWLDAEKGRRIAEADREAGDVRKRAEEAETAARALAEHIRRDAESHGASVRVDAETHAAPIRAEADRKRREAEGDAIRLRGEADAARAEATRQVEELLRGADQQAGDARRLGVEEACRVRLQAQEEALEHRRQADLEAGITRESARRDGAAALEAARVDAHELRQKAERDAAKLRGEAAREVEQARGAAERDRIAAEERAAQRIATAELEAVRASRIESTRIFAEAEAEAEERLERVATREDQQRTRHAEQEDRERAQQDEDTALSRRDRALDARSRRLAERELDVERDAQEQALRRETLVEAEGRLGAAARERLDQSLTEAGEALAESRRRNRELAEERDRLRDALAAAGGPDVEARQEDVERLRRENGALRAKVAEMLPADEADALRRERDSLLGARAEALAASQHARDMAEAQQQADRAMARTRQDADRLVKQAQAELERQVAEVDRVTSMLAVVDAERAALAGTADEARRGKEDIERIRIDRDFLEAQLEEARRVLDDRTRLLKKNAKQRYPVLAEMDEDPPKSKFGPTEPAPPLAALVARTRATLAAGGRTYDNPTLCAWIASLAAHRLIVVKGRSGTGKTSLPVHFADAVGGGRVVVPVQSGWRDRADLLGYFNTFDNRFRAQPFTEAVYKANSPDFRDRPFFIVLDECNLSRLEYYFADLLSELELDPEKGGIDKLKHEEWTALKGDGRPPHLIRVSETGDAAMAPRFLPQGRFLCLPPNVWIIATANEDESTFEIADKTYDRAGILQMDARADLGKVPGTPLKPIAWGDLTGQFGAVQRAWPTSKRTKLAEWVAKLDAALQGGFEVGFGNRFVNHAELFLPVYEALGGTLAGGADHLLRTRILRKVDRVRDPGLRQAASDLREVVDMKWPWDGGRPVRSLDALDKLYIRLS
ncbi:MAG: hypothetical protein V4850_17765 [Myxococcota bacterium]